ncbi:uncharacterized protein [Dendropsophus ebraccatus]|uniref:uncharacterized protein n=1 Tax=Dendropsophus ebraccatus TaxID=150705 RepID=UPI003831CA65
MGSTSTGASPSGTMVSRGKTTIIKLQGVVSSPDVLETGRRQAKTLSYTHPIGQCNNSRPSSTPGQCEEKCFTEHLCQDISVGRGKHSFPQCHSPQRLGKRRGRLSEQAHSPFRGVVPQKQDIPIIDQQMGSTPDRSFCHGTEQEDARLLLSRSQRWGTGNRCASSTLELQSGICLPSHSFDTQSPTDLEGTGVSNLDCTLLDEEVLVRPTSKPCSRTSDPTTAGAGPSISGPSSPSRSPVTKAVSMDPERCMLRSKGLSEEVITTIQKSRKPVTNKIYLKIWKVFLSWCPTKPPFPADPNITLILEFLQAGLLKGLKPATLRVQVTALSTIYDYPIAEHRWVKRFLRSAQRQSPSIRNLHPPWDLNSVLESLTRAPFEPLEEADIKLLSYKTAFLVAIVSARRVSELQALTIREPYFLIEDDRITLRTDPNFLPKVVSSFHQSQDIILPSFCSSPKNDLERKFHTWDVRRSIIQYLDVCSTWRKEQSLFIQFQGKNKGRKVSKSVLARWIRNAIEQSYILQNLTSPLRIRAHSTRAVSTTWAERASASIDQICRAATWSSPHTFTKHYRLQLQRNEDLTFGRKVLQAVVPP